MLDKLTSGIADNTSQVDDRINTSGSTYHRIHMPEIPNNQLEVGIRIEFSYRLFAIEKGIVERTRTEARQALSSFLDAFGYEAEIVFEGGTPTA